MKGEHKYVVSARKAHVARLFTAACAMLVCSWSFSKADEISSASTPVRVAASQSAGGAAQTTLSYEERADQLVNAFPERVPNLRLVKPLTDTLIEKFMYGYLDRRVRQLKEPPVVFVGESFSWGYPYAESLTFPSLFGQKASVPVLNLSIFGGRIEWTARTLCALKAQGGPFKGVYVAFPWVASLIVLNTAYNKQGPKAASKAASVFNSCPEGIHGDVADILDNDISDEDALAMLTKRHDRRNTVEFRLAPLRDGYFISSKEFQAIRPYYFEQLKAIMRMASDTKADVVILISPILMPAISSYKYSERDVQEQLTATVEFCNEVAKTLSRVRCAPPPDSINSDVGNFGHITHLNLAGMAKYADFLNEAYPPN